MRVVSVNYLDQGIAHHRAGRLELAEQIYRDLLQGNPADADALHLLGMVAKEKGRLNEAARFIRLAISIQPSAPQFHNNLASVLGRAGRQEEALAAASNAVALRPDYPQAHMNMGVACEQLGRLDQAVSAYREALRWAPQSPEVHNHLGALLFKLGCPSQAMACHRRAVELRPNYTEAYIHLGTAYAEQGNQEMAIACCRKSIALSPGSTDQHSDLLHLLHYSPECDREQLRRESMHWARQHAEPLTAAAKPATNLPRADRRLRVGYVSADFHEHPVARFIEPILESHDRSRFTVYCYCDPNWKDEVTARLRALADVWCDTGGKSDEQFAELVRTDEIDILVDLSGHMAANRLLAFARKPAPVQVTVFGYPGTTGMSAMDYRVSDPYSDVPGVGEAWAVEQLIRLPHCAWCYRPSADSPTVDPPPVLATGHITFGCLNKPLKVTVPAIGVWADILRRVPGSRLWLFGAARAGEDGHQSSSFARHGIEAGRVQFLRRTTRTEYLRYLGQLDIALDPFPYNGGVTSADTLWMGVPLVTLAGNSYHSRQGVMLLSNIGCEGLVARTAEQYADIAVALASDTGRLSQLRAGMRDRMARSALLNGPAFTRELERAYREAWSRWCRGHVE